LLIRNGTSYSLLIGPDRNRHHHTTTRMYDDDHWPDVHRDDADPPDPPLYDEPIEPEDHPSLSAADRNSRLHCT